MTEQHQRQAPGPAPVLPARWGVWATELPPHMYVVVTVDDAAGTRYLFIEPGDADKIGREIIDAARQCRNQAPAS